MRSGYFLITDKGWESYGLSQDDLFLLRCLLEASRSVERELRRENVRYTGVVFIRNDVYQLLMRETPDFGKEMKAALDWSDLDLLRQLLKLRIVDGAGIKEDDFESVFSSICVQMVGDREVVDFMIDYSFMRPRNLLNCSSIRGPLLSTLVILELRSRI